MTLSDAKALCESLMAQHGLVGWSFTFHHRRRSLGTCNYTLRTIFLSKVLVPVTTLEEVRNTILHEIAHALTPGQHHNHVWRRKAIEIGCTGTRCFDYTEAQKSVVSKLAKYKAVCVNGHEHFKHRMPKSKRWCIIDTCRLTRGKSETLLEYKLNTTPPVPEIQMTNSLFQ